MSDTPNFLAVTHRSPVARKLALIVLVFGAVVGCLLLIVSVQMEIMSAVRAYVGGEGYWSKGQKDGVIHLMRYATSHDERDWDRYRDAIAAPLGDREARIELEKAAPDLERAHRGLVQGRNHRDDLGRIVMLFRRFRRLSYMAEAVDIWTKADRDILKLTREAEALHGAVLSRGATAAGSAAIVGKIRVLNERITPFEDAFSRTLGEGARQVQTLLMLAVCAATALLLSIALLLSWMMLRRIREGERYRHLLDSASDAILVADVRTGCIVAANRRSEELLGVPANQIVGREQAALVPDEERARYRHTVAACLAGAHGSTADLHVGHAGGDLIPIELSAGSAIVAGRAVLVTIVRDVSAQKRAEEALRASRQRWEAEARISAALARAGEELLSAPETLALHERLCQLTKELLGCDGSQVLVWDAAEDGYTEVAACGITPADTSVPRETLSLVFAVEPGGVAEIPCQGGHTRLGMALWRGKEIIGVLLASRRSAERFTPEQRRLAQGIAHLGSMALANAQLVTKLEHASRLKSEFVSTMSHELRTPIHVMLGYAELARDPEADVAYCLGRIEAAGGELAELVESTLEIGRIESGRDEVRLERVELPAFWAALADSCGRLPRQPEVILDWSRDVAAVSLVTDPRKLTVVIRNLVGNALKFTPRGWVQVSARVGPDAVTFGVADSGIGVRREDQEKIFEMFRQADGSETRRFGGAGLGLYIVRRFAEQLGGSVTLESTPGRGSLFTVILPRMVRAPMSTKRADAA